MTCKNKPKHRKSRAFTVSKPLTQKERIYVESRLSGMTQVASAAAAGCNNPNTDGNRYENKERVQKELVARMQKVSEEVDFSRRDAHDLLMQASPTRTQPWSKSRQ